MEPALIIVLLLILRLSKALNDIAVVPARPGSFSIKMRLVSPIAIIPLFNGPAVMI